MRIGPLEYDEATRIAAGILDRHKRAQVGADRRSPGKYAVYFYDASGEEIRSVGGFASPREASKAVYFIVAATIVEDVSVWEHDSALDPEGGDV